MTPLIHQTMNSLLLACELFFMGLALSLIVRQTLAFWAPEVSFSTALKEAARAQPWAATMLVATPLVVAIVWLFALDS